MKKDNFFLSSLSIQRNEAIIPASICLSFAQYKALKAESLDFLNKKEMLYFNTLKSPRRQFSYLLGRLCAKKALTILDERFASKEVCIEQGVFGQPILCALIPHTIQVSISHSQLLGGAIAFPEGHPMGIDIEKLDVTKVALLENQLTRDEKKLLSVCGLPWQTGVFCFWSAKEALSKVLRCGLTVPFDLLEINELRKQNGASVLYFKNFSQYKACSLNLPNYVLSLVLPKNSNLSLEDMASKLENVPIK